MFILLIAATLQATPAAATEPKPTVVASVKVVGSKPNTVVKADKVVCRTDEHTGTRLTTRTCHTDREWRELEFQSSEWLRQMRPLPCMQGSDACKGPL